MHFDGSIVKDLVLAVLGAILGLAVTRWDSWRQTSKRGDLRGDWFSVSHAGDHERVDDKIVVGKRFGKLYFRNVGNQHGYKFEGYCTVEAEDLLSGNWKSTRDGSSSAGKMLMVVNAQATVISGVYSGRMNDGRDVIFGWILAKTEPELEQALVKLNKVIQLPKGKRKSGTGGLS